MNLMMFPKMLSSHDEGWTWLTGTRSSVPKTLLLYVTPMSLIPPAMLLYAAANYRTWMPGDVSLPRAWVLAAVFFVAELLAVALVAAVIRRIGSIADLHPTYEEAFAFAAVVPTPLWLTPLALFIPSPWAIALVMPFALFASGLLIYEGSYRVFRSGDPGEALLLSGSVLAAGLVAWIALMLIAFVSWGWMVM